MINNPSELARHALADLISGFLNHPALAPKLANAYRKACGFPEDTTPESLQAFLKSIPAGYSVNKDSNWLITDREKVKKERALPEDKKMNMETIQHFFLDLAYSKCSDNYVADSMMFFLSTLSDMIDQDEPQKGVQDFIDDLQEYLFTHLTQYGMRSRNKYVENIAQRWMETNYNDEHTLNENIDKEITGTKTESKEDKLTETPNILDLSSQTTAEDECIDLAKHLSAVLNDPRTPEVIKANLKDGLSDLFQPSQFMTTPEYIAEMLCVKENQIKEVTE